jgi:hypothetical protein
MARPIYWRSYSPLAVRLRTVKPAFLASVTESGLSLIGELKGERTLRTGFLQAGHCVSGFAFTGRRKVNLPPHTTQLPSQSWYSYKGTARQYNSRSRTGLPLRPGSCQ